jgi:sigma-B regulation protein RsbU (phosphoserine phosphatase)
MESLHQPPAGDDRYLQLRQLTEVSRALTNAVSLEEVVRLTVERAAEMMGAERAALLLADDRGELMLQAWHNVSADLCDRFRQPNAEDLGTRLAGLLGVEPGRTLGVPLVATGQVIGVLAVAEPPPPLAGEGEWLLSALADQAAVALEKARLDETSAFRERLMGIVGHDLRNPLQAIQLAAARLMRQDSREEAEVRLVRQIENSSSRMANMIEQLLDFTRSRLGGGFSLSPEKLDLAELCQAVNQEMETAYPRSTLHFDCSGQLLGEWDRDRLWQVISNLIANAIQHGAPEGTIRVVVEGRVEVVQVSVHNEGPPIPAELLPTLFSPFRRADSGRRGGRGLGLGLYIAEQIVRAHGGKINVESVEGVGTTVAFELPRIAACSH